MAIIATDILIKTMIEAAIVDLKKNAWILDDVFGGLVTDPLSNTEYGYKEVQKAKEWFLNNNINIYLHNRIDNPTFPCITIVQANSSEIIPRTALGDEGRIEPFMPKGRVSQPQQVIPPFTPVAYAPTSNIPEQGVVTLPENLNTDAVAPGQFLVSNVSGHAYAIIQVISSSAFTIKSGVVDDFTGAYVAPQSSVWNLQREESFLEETYAIGVHAASYPVNCIWLRQAVMYIMMRYKESYLESRGFELSTINSTGADENPHFSQEKIYSCVINLSGQIEMNWVKYIAPRLQQVTAKISIIDGPKTPPAYASETNNQGWNMVGDLAKTKPGYNGFTPLPKRRRTKGNPDDPGDTGGF